ncbi:nucleolar protein 9 isoform X2 [Chamaea fasciata]|uniref:nucleolar protein 9 isoform X2 n=1 Tax=Chamaea fasciata TaxID=190680 RepID=UPI003369D741
MWCRRRCRRLAPPWGRCWPRGTPGWSPPSCGRPADTPPPGGGAQVALPGLALLAPPHHPHCITALAQLRPLEDGDSKEGAESQALAALSPWGSLALQELLAFRRPAALLRSLRALPAPALRALARSAPGSRLWEALLGSAGLPRREQRRLLGGLRGEWAELARDRSGSRVLDAAWAWSDARRRLRLARELAPHLPQLLRDPHGCAVARNLGLELFLRDRKGWSQSYGGRGPKR